MFSAAAAAAAATFEGLLMASFQIVKNLLSYFGLYESFLNFWRREYAIANAFEA